MTKHELVPLGSFLSLARDEVVLEPTTPYQPAGIYSFGRGIFLRPATIGAETKYRTLYRLHEGQFVVSRLKAFEGAIAVVTAESSGALVSQEFPTFNIATDRALPAFVGWLCRWPRFWDLLAAQSRGIGARRERIQPTQVLQVRIPLPPVGKQRRLVDVLDSIETRRASAQDLGGQVATMAASGWLAVLAHEFAALERERESRPLSEVAHINPESVNPSVDLSGQPFVYVDISSVEKGTGRIGSTVTVPGDAAPSRARKRIRTGDVLVSTVRPNLRGFAIVPKELDGQVCSTGFAVLRPLAATSPRYLLYQVLSNRFLDQLTTRGGHYPAVNDSVLRAARVVLPSRQKQEELVKRMDWMRTRFEQIGSLARAQNDRLAALLPATLDQLLIPSTA